MKFVLIPGAGGSGWYWHRVAALLRDAGHEALAVDLPGEDETAGLPEYAAIVLAAIGERTDVVLAAQSLGGFTAPMVSAKHPVASLVLVNAMVPTPGETPGDWWANTGSVEARQQAADTGGYGDFDVATYFLHDVPAKIVAEGEGHQFPEADAVFDSVCEFSEWPDVPIRVLSGKDDRFFPVDFQRAVARQRLGIAADVLPGGHLMALSHPDLVAGYLLNA